MTLRSPVCAAKCPAGQHLVSFDNILDGEMKECKRLGEVWEALSKVTAELNDHGVNVPPDIYSALRGAKTPITLCKGHPKLEDLVPGDIDSHEGFCVACCGADIVARIKCELRNIEDLLVIKATQELGNDYAVKLQQRTMKAWEPLQVPLVPP